MEYNIECKLLSIIPTLFISLPMHTEKVTDYNKFCANSEYVLQLSRMTAFSNNTYIYIYIYISFLKHCSWNSDFMPKGIFRRLTYYSSVILVDQTFFG